MVRTLRVSQLDARVTGESRKEGRGMSGKKTRRKIWEKRTMELEGKEEKRGI
jgi:hypothetical protein